MKLEIYGKNYTVSDKLKGLIEKKLSKCEKFFDKSVSVKVVCSRQKDREKMEITLNSGSAIIRSEVETDNMYANLDICSAKLEKQIIKYGDKNLSQRNKNALKDFEFFDEVPTFVAPKITKRKIFDLVPMSEADAIRQMDMVGNDFFIFENIVGNKVCVLYKRADGDIGLIETK